MRSLSRRRRRCEGALIATYRRPSVDERESFLKLALERCSPREHQVLSWWSLHYGVVKIAVLLGVSESTVRTHLRRALLRMDDAVS